MEPAKRPFGTKSVVHLRDEEITKIIDLLHDEGNPILSPYDSLLELAYIANVHVKDLTDLIMSLNNEISHMKEVIDEKDARIEKLRNELNYLYEDVQI